MFLHSHLETELMCQAPCTTEKPRWEKLSFNEHLPRREKSANTRETPSKLLLEGQGSEAGLLPGTVLCLEDGDHLQSVCVCECHRERISASL